MYYSSCCSCSFEAEIIKIGQSSHKMYSNNILNFSRVHDNFKCPYEKSLETYRMNLVCVCIYIYIYIYIYNKLEILKIGQSSHKMESNNILNFSSLTTNINACTKKKAGNLLNKMCVCMYVCVCVYIYIYIYIYVGLMSIAQECCEQS